VSDPLYAWIILRQHEVEQLVYLYRTRPHLGGDRWWFVCPGEDRRARTLYLPPGAKLFGTRQAYHLAYTSQRRSEVAKNDLRARVRAVRQIQRIFFPNWTKIA
jgi:hypothetical protein